MLALLLVIGLVTSKSCNSSVLNYYGLKGLLVSMSYAPMAGKVEVDRCPKIRNSCCSLADWQTLETVWEESSKVITDTLTQLYSVMQAGISIQTSIIKLLPKLISMSGKACKQIDVSFFAGLPPFDLVDFQLTTAFQTMAQLQKGFPCLICDADAHSYFNFGVDYNRYILQVSQSTCTSLMKYFHDFITFKFYYFDPLMINLNQVANCAGGSEDSYFDNWFRSTYQTINDCLLHQDNCEDVCAEFALGTTGNLFAGDLKRYNSVLTNLQKKLALVGEFNVELLEQEPVESPRNEFFTSGIGPSAVYASGNLTRYSMVFMDKGIDLFSYASQSKYTFGNVAVEDEEPTIIPTDPLVIPKDTVTPSTDNNPSIVPPNDDIDSPFADSPQDSPASLPIQSPEQIHEDTNQKLDDMAKDNKSPLPSEVAALDNGIGSLEDQFMASLNQQSA